ncbi:MAG: hypothetical protein FWF59_10740 [Turicibacter sp.]|nr:hypothetical protein [Turicibacter sp.]
MRSKTGPIYIIYHVAIMGNWEEVLKEQLRLLENTGLGDAAVKIHVNVAGNIGRTSFLRILSAFRDYPKMDVQFFPSLDVYEFPSIEKAKVVAAGNPAAKILYFHTKGVSAPIIHSKYPEAIKNLAQWRKLMDHFILGRWEECYGALRHYDACGVEWNAAERYFAGNYWWANASYLNRCQLGAGSRYECEMFIGTGKPRQKNMFSSINNPKLHLFFTPAEIMAMKTPAKGGEIFDYVRYFYDPAFYQEGVAEIQFVLSLLAEGKKVNESMALLKKFMVAQNLGNQEIMAIATGHVPSDKLEKIRGFIQQMGYYSPKSSRRR